MYDFFSPVPAIRKITKQKAEKNIAEAYSYLNNDFRAVANLFERYYPLELLKLSLWDERKILSQKKKDSIKRASAVLLPVILQSVLSSTFVSGFGSVRSVSDKDWERLRGLSDDIVRRIIRIIENKSALFLSASDAEDGDAVKYREIISLYLLPEEVKKESLSSSSIMLRSLLEEKEGLEEKIGADKESFWINIDNIAKNGLNAIDDLCRRVQTYSDEYRAAYKELADELKDKSNEEIFSIITKKKGWEGRAEGLAIERDGYSLFALSSLSALSSSCYAQFTAEPGSLDIMSFLNLGYWPSARFPFIRLDGDIYTFVAKHIPSFISLSSSFDRKEATLKSVLSIFFQIGIDTYTYDGNSIDISVLPSFFDRNLFTDPSSYSVIKKKRDEERALKTQYGHKRLIVDPDQTEDKITADSALLISSSFMAEAVVNRNKKHELIESLLGELELPETDKEYKVVDEEEIERETAVDDDENDDSITDEYEYDNGDEDNLPVDEIDDGALVEYEKKPVDIAKEEERYSLPLEIAEKEEEAEREEAEYSRELDDDIFDDTEEEERLDEIGEKEENDYYLDIDQDETVKEEEKEEENSTPDDEPYDDGQLDFFNLLDDEVEEEKVIDDVLEKEDEEEFVEEEEKEEALDENKEGNEVPPTEEESFPLPGVDEEEKIIDDDLEKEDEEEFVEEEEKEEALDEDAEKNEVPPVEDESFPLPGVDEEEKIIDDDLEKEDEDEEEFVEEEEKEEALDEDAEGNEVPPVEEESFPLPGVDEEEKIIDESLEEAAEDKESGVIDALPSDDEETVDEDAESQKEDSSDELSQPLSDVDEGTEEFSLPSVEEERQEPRVEEAVSEEKSDDFEFALPPQETKDSDAYEPDGNDSLSSTEEEQPVEEKTDVNSWMKSFMTLDDEEESVDSIDTPVVEEENIEEDLKEPEIEEPQMNEEENTHTVISMDELEDEKVELPLMGNSFDEDDNSIVADGILYDIYKKLGSTSVFSSFLRDTDEETQEELEKAINGCWSRMMEDGKDKLFNIPSYSLSIILSRDRVRDDLRLSELLNNAGGVMYSRGEESWTAVILYINQSFMMEEALEKRITPAGFSPSDWKRVTYIGEQMKKR